MKKFIKDNYVLILTLLTLLLIIIGSVIIIKTIKNNNKNKYKTENVEVYQYVGEKKEDLKLTIKYTNNKITSIKSDNSIYDEAILYYNDQTKVLFPNDMELVYYNLNNTGYKVEKYTTYDGDLLNKKDVINAFMYNGEDLYFFLEDYELNIDGQSYQLSAMSYVIAYNNYVFVYNYSDDKVMEFDNVNIAYVTMDDAKVNVLKDVTIIDGNVNLIIKNIDSLNAF